MRVWKVNQLLALAGLCSAQFITEQCGEQLGKLTADAPELLQAMDSWGKPVGILRGAFTSLGDFKECVRLDGSAGNQVAFNQVTVEGNLKLNSGNTSASLQSTLGICVPQSCDNMHDVISIFMLVVENINELLEGGTVNDASYDKYPSLVLAATQAWQGSIMAQKGSSIKYLVDKVHVFKPIEWSAGSIVMVSLWGFFALLTIVSTTIDYIKQYRQVDSAYKLAFQSKLMQQTEEDDLADSIGGGNSHTVDSQTSDGAVLLPKSSRDTLFNAIGNQYTLKVNPKPNFGVKVLRAFSLYETLPFLFNTETKRFKELRILNVVRVLSIFWVAFGHSLGSFLETATLDPLDLMELAKTPPMMVLFNSFLSVDSFFYLSAFLVTYMFVSDPKSMQKFNFFKYVLFRFLRLTPAAMMILFTHWFIFPLVGGGNSFGGSPMWYANVERINTQCPKFWWTHLLYISNFYPQILANQCFPALWYVSADMQLYILLPFFLVPILAKRKMVRRLGWLSIIVVGVIGNFLYTFVPSMVYKIPALPTPVFNSEHSNNEVHNDLNFWQEYYYQKSYSHCAVMLTGILAAYACINLRKLLSNYIERKQISITQWRLYASLIQLLGGFLMVLVLYLPYDYVRHLTRWQSAAANSFYNFYSRWLWSIGLSLIIMPSIVAPVFTAIDGDSVDSSKLLLISKLASARIWTVLSKLVFLVYMIHVIYINIWVGSELREQSYSWPVAVNGFGGIMFWSYLTAAVVFLIFEAPMGTIVKLLTR
ncbi:hypothetical protein MIR68_010844 [Amoeboaphelidium protococcarum]|nr:hypothetical protein MIR68_010844 [Amoeboaphelidium protococcarum]